MNNVSSSNSQKALVPEIRFPEFRDDLQQSKLSDISVYKTKRATDVKSHYISTENLLQNCMGIVPYTDETAIDGISFSINDILLGNIRPYLKKAWLAEFDGVCSTDVLVLHPLKIEPSYFKYLICRDKFFTYVMSSAKGSKMPRGDKAFIMDMTISLPSINEQKKLASMLTLIDTLISKQEKMVDELKLYKRGLINQIFDNKLSLSKNSEWHKYQLSDILKERKTYCEKDGTYEHATLSKEGVYGKTDQYNRDYLVSSDDKKYKITKLGDICYNPANLKFGVICLNTYGDAIFSPIYITFEVNKNFNKEFIAFCLTRNDFINKALQYQQGTVYERMAVSPEDLLSMSINLPPRKIQDSLAKVILKIEDMVSKTEMKLTELKQMRAALLQKMFI